MIETLPFQQLSEALSRGIGLHFPPERWNDLGRGLRAASQELGFADSVELAGLVLSRNLSIDHIKVLARYLTIPETYFFRDRSTMLALRDQILSDLINERRQSELRLRIWSAGCCSGEEPYTIAILLRELLSDYEDWVVSILGTDINPVVLAKAASGSYSDWSFREVPEGFKENYFSQEGKRFQVRRDLLEMVTFGFLNLAADPYPALTTNTEAMDLIFCRNVLMYFSREEAIRCVEKFHKCLTPGGWLVVSAGESSFVSKELFDCVSLPDAVFYKKRQFTDVENLDRQLSKLETSIFRDQLSFGGAILNLESVSDLFKDKKSPGQRNEIAPVTLESEEDFVSIASEYYDQGRYDEVVSKLKARILKYPEHFQKGPEQNNQVFVLLARSYANQGKLAEALDWCEQGIKLNPLDAQLYYLRSSIFQSQRQPKQVLESLRKSLFLDPDFILSHYGLGNHYLKDGQKVQAARSYRNALALVLKMDKESLLPEGEGLTAGRLAEIIETTLAAL